MKCFKMVTVELKAGALVRSGVLQETIARIIHPGRGLGKGKRVRVLATGSHGVPPPDGAL